VNVTRELKAISEDSQFALLGNYWMRFPETSKKALEAIVKSWNFFKPECDPDLLWGKWEKMVNSTNIRHKVHKKCEHCNRKVQFDAEICNKPSCATKAPAWGFWMTFSIEDQLRKILQGMPVLPSNNIEPNMHVKLKYRFTRQKEGDFSDIYDGEVYSLHLPDGKGGLRFWKNISLTMFVDGAPKGKAGSAWPAIFVINELSPKERFLHGLVNEPQIQI
jgi:hypothetical protein